jgi:hypothetical protein
LRETLREGSTTQAGQNPEIENGNHRVASHSKIFLSTRIKSKNDALCIAQCRQSFGNSGTAWSGPRFFALKATAIGDSVFTRTDKWSAERSGRFGAHLCCGDESNRSEASRCSGPAEAERLSRRLRPVRCCDVFVTRNSTDGAVVKEPAPTLAIMSTSLNLPKGGTVVLPISVAGFDGDDTVRVGGSACL